MYMDWDSVCVCVLNSVGFTCTYVKWDCSRTVRTVLVCEMELHVYVHVYLYVE